MATITERLAFLVSANADQAIRAFDKTANAADKELGKAQKSIDKIGAAMSSFGARGLASAGILSAGLFKMAQSAADDEKAQKLLAQQLKSTTKATDQQIASVEDYIDATARATGITDDELRPAFQTLARTTGSIAKSQKLLNLALDISAGTGKDVGAVALALSKAYTGNIGALTRLGVPIDANIKKSKDFEGAIKNLSERFTGQAATAADTFAGRMARAKVAVDEAKEEIGRAFIPVLQTGASVISNTATTLQGFNERTAGAVGKLATFGTVGLGAVSALSLLGGQAIKARNMFTTLGDDGERSLNKMGKAAKAAGIAFATIAISEAIFTAINNASGATDKLNDSLKRLLITSKDSKAATGDLTTNFAAMAKAEDDTLKLSHLWTDWGKKIKIAGSNAAQPIEDIDAAFKKLLQTSPAIAEQTLSDWSKMANALDHSTQQYKDNISLIERYTKMLNLQTGATDALAKANEEAAAAEAAAQKAADEKKAALERAKAATEAYNAKVKELRKTIGEDFVTASDSARKALDNARKAFDEYASKVSDAVTASYSFVTANEAVKNSTSALQDAQSKVVSATDAVSAAKRRVRDANWELADAETAYNAALASGVSKDIVESYRSLVKAKESATDAQGELTKAETNLSTATTEASTATAEAGKSFLDRLGEQATTASQFGDKVQKLVAAGLTKDALQLVLDAGADAGGQIAGQLLAGGQDAIDKANKLTESVKAAGKRAGTDAASTYYTEGINIAQNLVNGIDSILKNYKLKLTSKGLTDKQLKRLQKKFAVDVAFQFDTANVEVPELADGGIVPATRGGRLIRVAEGGRDEAIIPLPSRGSTGATTIEINVNTGVGDPNEIGRQVVAALQSYQRRAGAIPIKVA